jgi:hypothetical protein
MTTVYDQSASLTGTDDGDGNANQNLRFNLPTALLSAASGTQCQLEFRWGTAEGNEAGAVTSCWFGQSGTAPQFTGDQVQVKFGGASGFSGSAAGVVTSDVFTLAQAWDNTKRYTCALHILSTANGNCSVATVTGVDLWNAVGVDNASATNPGGMTGPTANTAFFLEKVIVTAGGAGGAAIAKINFKIDKFKTPSRSMGPNAGLFQVKAFPAPAAVAETNTHWQGRAYAPQWNRNALLLRGTAQDTSSSAVETNPSWRGRTYPRQWNVNEALFLTSTGDSPAVVATDTPTYFVPRAWPPQWKLNPLLDQTTAQDTSSSAVETNIHFIARTWPFQWNLIRALFQNPATDAPAAVADDPPSYVSRFLPSQWNLSRFLLRGTSQDFTSPAVETNPQWIGKPWVVSWKVNTLLSRAPSTDVPPPVIPDAPPGFVPHTWRVQWVVNLSLLRGTAQDFSSTPPLPPPTFPATYYLLQDLYINEHYLPAGTIQTTLDLGGVLPVNWVPNPNVDPVDANAIAAYRAVGYQPRGLSRQQFTVTPVLPSNYVWQMINNEWALVKVANFPRVP